MLFEIKEAFNHAGDICYNGKTKNEVGVLLWLNFLSSDKLDQWRTPLMKSVFT